MIKTKVLAAVLATALAMVVAAPLAGAATQGADGPQLTDIKVQANATFDRVELDFDTLPVYSWQPTDELTADPSGKPYSLPGNTYISLVAQNSSSVPTYPGSRKFTTPTLSNVRAVGITGDFERVLSFGIGLDHTATIHVSTLTGPNRLVIDVDH
ncbi:MAG TPA: hypothetical protein VGD48_33560 [Kutzneria sp.]|jgi:hypothetical protein